MDASDVLVVGAGQAGAQVAINLRQQGFAGSVCLIGEEAHSPYERPPLSKSYLAGQTDAADLALRPDAFWKDHRVQLVTGERVVGLDPTGRSASCASGRRWAYGSLVWTAGGQARKLECPGAGLGGVHVVRTRRDVDGLRQDLEGARRAVIVGGGYIGLETAAVLGAMGMEVTVLEAMDRVLARVTSPVVSAFYEAEHRRRGVQIRTSSAVASLAGDQRVREVVLADGTRLPADVVVVGIGLVPEIEVLRTAGAACGNGVEVDTRCRTGLSHVFAAGDCASHVNAYAGGLRVRLESVQNANDQAKVVAANIAGVPMDYHAVPWFWSQQYDLKLQTVGLGAGYEDWVVRGDPAARSFSVLYQRGGQLVALDCINAPRDFVLGKKLVVAGVETPLWELADPECDLGKVAVRAV